jgi:hypothetical protein
VPAPPTDPRDARLELARRYLHCSGPATPEAFGRWAGIRTRLGVATFEALKERGAELIPVRTPVGDAWALAQDEAALRATTADQAPPVSTASTASTATARLLPSGDAYTLLHGADRSFLVPDAKCRDSLWTLRVWPGALLVGGELTGTWRRAGATLTVQPWRQLSPAERDAVTAEAESLPLPGVDRRIAVRWEGWEGWED